MAYTSHLKEVMKAMELCKEEFCQGVGVLAVAEVQSLVPVDTGNLRRSIASENMSNNEGIYIGATTAAPYAVTIEKGLSNHVAQPFLEPGIMNSIPKITKVAERIYRNILGGA